MMLPCNECFKLISEKAKMCPKCGTNTVFSPEMTAPFIKYFSYSIPAHLHEESGVTFENFSGVVKEMLEREDIITEGVNAGISTRVHNTQKFWIDNPVTKADHYAVTSSQNLPISNGMPVSILFARKATGGKESVIAAINLLSCKSWIRPGVIADDFCFFEYPSYFRPTIALMLLFNFAFGASARVESQLIMYFIPTLLGCLAFVGYFIFQSQQANLKKKKLIAHTEKIVEILVNAFRNQNNPGPELGNGRNSGKPSIFDLPQMPSKSELSTKSIIGGFAILSLIIGYIFYTSDPSSGTYQSKRSIYSSPANHTNASSRSIPVEKSESVGKINSVTNSSNRSSTVTVATPASLIVASQTQSDSDKSSFEATTKALPSSLITDSSAIKPALTSKPHQESYEIFAIKPVEKYLYATPNKHKIIDALTKIETEYMAGSLFKNSSELKLQRPVDLCRYMDVSVRDGAQIRVGYLIYPENKRCLIFYIGRPDEDFERNAIWELKKIQKTQVNGNRIRRNSIKMQSF